MAQYLSVRKALQRIVANPRMTCKARRQALAELISVGCPTAFLQRLMKDKTIPLRLLDDVLVAFSAKMMILDYKRKQKAAPKSGSLVLG